MCLVLAETILLAIVVPLVKASIGDSIMYSSVSFLSACFMSSGVYCGWNGELGESWCRRRHLASPWRHGQGRHPQKERRPVQGIVCVGMYCM